MLLIIGRPGGVGLFGRLRWEGCVGEEAKRSYSLPNEVQGKTVSSNSTLLFIHSVNPYTLIFHRPRLSNLRTPVSWDKDTFSHGRRRSQPIKQRPTRDYPPFLPSSSTPSHPLCTTGPDRYHLTSHPLNLNTPSRSTETHSSPSRLARFSQPRNIFLLARLYPSALRVLCTSFTSFPCSFSARLLDDNCGRHLSVRRTALTSCRACMIVAVAVPWTPRRGRRRWMVFVFYLLCFTSNRQIVL